MNPNKSAVVVLSGGLDSTVVLYMVKDMGFSDIHCLTFNYGQKHSKEIECAQYHAAKMATSHKVIDISFFGDIASSSALINKDKEVPKMTEVLGHPQPPTYVPNRNMMLLSIAAAHAENVKASHIFYGAAQVDTLAGYWDGSCEFVPAMNAVLGLNRMAQIQVGAPLINMSKAEIITEGKRLGVEFDRTWTCYRGEEQPCGVCASCSSRLQGFIDAGVVDPLPYAVNIPWSEHNCH